MLIGTHCMIYSKDAEADRKFFQDVLELPYVDAGEGWLIFKLPPAEIGFHPDENNNRQEINLICQDVEVFHFEMTRRGIPVSRITDQGWGLALDVTLPGGGKIGVYQPRHRRPE